jgi:hypothetical protein
MRILPWFLVLLVAISLFSCKKDDPLADPGARLEFSQDSVLFDTVFTAIGSTTKRFRIYNRNNQPVQISKLYLGSGNASNFRLNVDGIPGKYIENIEIPANDSVFVFVEVTVDPTSQNSPFVIRDSMVTELNGNRQHVILEAWGQNAYYHVPTVFPSNGFPAYGIIAGENQSITWTNDKPHVIYGYGVVDSTGTLTMQPGTRVYLHRNAGLWIYRFGTLKVMGVKGDPVTFQGTRLEQVYQDIPGQWDRIWINEGSTGNEIHYAEIRNGFIGIQAERFLELGPPTFLQVDNTKIWNMSGIGIFGVNFNINGHNNLVYNCGTYTFAGTVGGGYRFDHCTFANYWSHETRNTASIALTNRNSAQALALDSAYFNNCILTGDLSNELELDSGNVAFNYRFRNCIIKTTNSTSNTFHYVQVNNNANPLFNDPGTGNFHLNSMTSPAANTGNTSFGILHPLDIDAEPRPQGPAPDLGCYEDWGF